MMKSDCIEHIYDTKGYCEWIRKKVIVRQELSKCNECGNGKASEPKEVIYDT